MVTVAIEAEEYVDQIGVQEDNSPKAIVRNYFIEARPSGVGVVESLIGEHICGYRPGGFDAVCLCYFRNIIFF
jgi:hypothetical protein